MLERSFTYARYDRFLERLVEAGFFMVSLKDLSTRKSEAEVAVSLRHDVDEHLGSALEIGRLEHARGVRSTFFVLHTAAYWSEPGLIPTLRTLQDDYGHEVGWHNDLVTLQCIYGVEPKAYLEHELGRLRRAGVNIHGVSSHGSPYCYRFGYHNNYFFSDFSDAVPDFPNTEIVQTPSGRCKIERASLANFGLAYEAYHVEHDLYFSDSSFQNGARWHPDELEPESIWPGCKAIVLIHPCHWDASVAAKLRRLAHLLRSGRWRSPDRLPRT